MSSALFEGVLPKVANVLEVVLESETTTTPESRRRLVQASNALKDDLNRAKDTATHLQGGDMSLAEQEDISSMLNKLIARKRGILRKFAADINTQAQTADVKMDIDLDSTASTPAA